MIHFKKEHNSGSNSKAKHPLLLVCDKGKMSEREGVVFPQHSSSLLPFLPLGSPNKEHMAYCNTTTYVSPERRESVEDREDEDEGEEGREEEEQRPLCSGVLRFPVVRDHTLGLRMSDAPDAQARNDIQNQSYKGDHNFHSLAPMQNKKCAINLD